MYFFFFSGEHPFIEQQETTRQRCVRSLLKMVKLKWMLKTMWVNKNPRYLWIERDHGIFICCFYYSMLVMYLKYNGIQIMNVYECIGTNIFMRWKMKCSIQRSELNETFHLSLNENICSIAQMRKHSLFVLYNGCFTIRVHHLSHFWWKIKCFVIPQHAFFCVMNKPYVDYIKLLTYRHNLSWIQLKEKYFVYGLPLTNFRRGQFLTELRLALFKHMLLKHQYSLGKCIVANE